MENTEIVQVISDINKGIEKMKAEGATKSDLNNMQTELEKVKGLADLTEKQAEKIKNLELSVSELVNDKQTYKNETKNGFVEKLKSTVTEILSGVTGVRPVEKIKAVGPMTFTDNVTGTMPQATRESGINNIARQSFILEGLSDVANISGNTVEWVEESAPEGGADMTAEGATKSQWDTNWAVASTLLKKVTVFVKMSKELIGDIPLVMSEIQNSLLYQLNYRKELQLLSGTGLTVYAKGVTTYAQPLDLAALADTFPLNGSNRWDAIGAAVTQILTNMKGAAIPNVIVLSPADYFVMVHGSRSTTNEYIQPITITPNGASYNGIPILQHITIPAGYFLVGDMTKYSIRNQGDVQISMGTDGNDFTKNMVTILAEQRFAAFVKANDVESFVYSTFAAAKTHLEAAA